jgi:hypothetical protein
MTEANKWFIFLKLKNKNDISRQVRADLSIRKEICCIRS